MCFLFSYLWYHVCVCICVIVRYHSQTSHVLVIDLFVYTTLKLMEQREAALETSSTSILYAWRLWACDTEAAHLLNWLVHYIHELIVSKLHVVFEQYNVSSSRALVRMWPFNGIFAMCTYSSKPSLGLNKHNLQYLDSFYLVHAILVLWSAKDFLSLYKHCAIILLMY